MLEAGLYGVSGEMFALAGCVIGEESLLMGGVMLYAGSAGVSAGGLKVGGGSGGDIVESEGTRCGRSARNMSVCVMYIVK